MDVKEQFEYPLPILSIDTEEIVQETPGACEGSFRIRNTGGGTLSGRIFSNSGAVRFNPEYFDSNDVTVFYDFSPDDIYRPGDELNTAAVVMSTGGEKLIPITVRIVPSVIDTKEGTRITTLNDFMLYGRKYPLAARTLLMSREFMMWLFSTGYGYMELYEHIIKDPNKERALENFYVISGLKKQVVLNISEIKCKINIRPDERKIYNGIVPIKKSGWGYTEATVRLRGAAPWLKLGAERITSADFNDADTAVLNYYIDPSQLPGKYAYTHIVIRGCFADAADEKTVKVEVKRLPPMTAELSKEGYELSDRGTVRVVNNLTGDLPLEITVKDSFIKFEGRRYFVNDRADIPFNIKLTTLQSAQLALKKQPVIYSEIYLKASVGDNVIKKTLKLAIGT